MTQWLFLESFKYIGNAIVLIKLLSCDPEIAQISDNQNKVPLCCGFHLYLPIKPAFVWQCLVPQVSVLISIYEAVFCWLSVFHNAG